MQTKYKAIHTRQLTYKGNVTTKTIQCKFFANSFLSAKAKASRLLNHVGPTEYIELYNEVTGKLLATKNYYGWETEA